MKTIKKAQTGTSVDTIKKKTTAERLIEARENRRKLDSITAVKRAEIVRKKDSIIARQRPDNMTKEQYQAFQRKQNKQKDVPACDTADPNFKSTRCGTSKAASKQSKSDWSKKKNGGSIAKDGKWMQKAAASIKKRGTKGVCTGAKFGGPTCKPGSKRYNLAKTFKSIAAKRKSK